MPPKRVLSAQEWVGVAVSLVQAILRLVIAAVAALFQRSEGPSTYYRHFCYAGSRILTGSLSSRALATLMTSTDEGYKKFCSSRGCAPETVVLADGTRGHWIGDKTVEKVMFFCHGGGYVVPALDVHFELLHQTVQEAERKGNKLAVLLLSYDVSVDASYPRQLQQACQLLDYLIHTENRDPSNIILAGDSAGANLALAILSHILHAHPHVPPLTLTNPFRGVALLSPWVTFDTKKTQSMQLNRQRDALDTDVLHRWATQFRGSAPTDPYMEPLSAPEDWWRGLPARDVLITAGDDEIFLDDIEEMGRRLQSVHPKTKICVLEDESHNHMILELTLREDRSETRLAFEKWVCSVLAD
ncbi:alpha/beta-hydrolase [Aspergillus candidus]|uniref:Alpha/beta-hydrolase n=1 Tax=Aspergillus candidus TaxID=41067 RepID=A0A2I2F0E9_ASPCN|nr:alpha/beta-hydrolase [Aspergillus candidus]PLB34107.1 alpha/beta-hydrolase [Aspergillus candidus]